MASKLPQIHIRLTPEAMTRLKWLGRVLELDLCDVISQSLLRYAWDIANQMPQTIESAEAPQEPESRS